MWENNEVVFYNCRMVMKVNNEGVNYYCRKVLWENNEGFITTEEMS